MALQTTQARSAEPPARVTDHTLFGASHDAVPPPTRAALHTIGALVAANDDGPRKWYQVRNPLWVIVMAMAFQFSVMALIVALG